ncbi:hypothetical protein L0F37_12455 [Klebsiella pneumoniae]|uniref:hypothetical protein n=1 Tax=Klebsiella pneumoniae TaxID=573 RepID=UPI00301D96B7|nr:hypothetical protein [Klebsiella pneumoniae]HCD7324990.1 hypothetical protein [Klebsiella pneumoniae]
MNNENGLTPSQLAERNAILVTEIEKCRELSGCPADVDLQDWVKMLVSELSVVEAIHNSAVFITDELYDASPKEVQGIIRSLACMKMPAYASLVAGIKAEAKSHDLNAFISHYSAELDNHIANGGDQFDERAVRLRGVIVGARMFREKLRDEEKALALREEAGK